MSDNRYECGCERGGDCTKTTMCAIRSAIEDKDAEIERLFASEQWLLGENAKLREVVDALECDAEWCGKSPRGVPGKRGHDDGKCQICRAKAALGGDNDRG